MWCLEPLENFLGASMPLQLLQALGMIVAEVAAHPSRDVGVLLGMAEVPAGRLIGMVWLGASTGGEGAGGG